MARLRNKYAGEEMDPLIVSEEDIRRCPAHSLDPGHYFRIGEEVACDCPLRYTDDSYSEQILDELYEEHKDNLPWKDASS